MEKKQILTEALIRQNPYEYTYEEIAECVGNEKADEKCIIDYIGFGPIKFKKEEEFFTEIFNFVTLKHFLIINESPLDKKAKSSLTIELKYKNETKIINYEPNFDEN